MAAKKEERAVLVTTAHKGIFFGYTDYQLGDVLKKAPISVGNAPYAEVDSIVLKRARLCVYWTADLRGFMGLASMGPGNGCKIGPACDIELRNITSVTEVSPEAVKKWEDAPWS
jgi:hypothetical protein